MHFTQRIHFLLRGQRLRLTCDSSFGVEQLEKLLWEDAMTDFASLLWQRGYWGQTLGRSVEGARALDQTVGDTIIKLSLKTTSSWGVHFMLSKCIF